LIQLIFLKLFSTFKKKIKIKIKFEEATASTLNMQGQESPTHRKATQFDPSKGGALHQKGAQKTWGLPPPACVDSLFHTDFSSLLPRNKATCRPRWESRSH